MLFTEPIFWFLFLPLLLGLHALAPRPLRNGLLLLASLIFYAWGERLFVFVMLASIIFNYVVGLWIDDRRDLRSRERRWPLAVGVVGNLLLLAAYKYANFLADQLGAVFAGLGGAGPELGPIHLPIGISFFTFQGMSYVIDVHRGETPVQRHPLRLALYIAMFPQLIAGPIVRYGRIAAQLVQRTIDRRGFADGVRRFTAGLGKKVLIANTVALPADTIFALPADQLTIGAAWLGIVCYTLQIYFDFSGYSDMAIGLGRMFGFQFPENFDYPYTARSITEFWRRWHMTLSNWFRDYLYLPLGGNRVGRMRLVGNLFTVFVLCGLWHGASWTFVVWGLYHGALLSLERLGSKQQFNFLPRGLRQTYVLLAVLMGWVLFRCESVGRAGEFFAAMFGFGGQGFEVASVLNAQVVLAIVAGCLGSGPIVPTLSAYLHEVRRGSTALARGMLDAAATLGHGAVLLLSMLFVAADTYDPFIYFRF